VVRNAYSLISGPHGPYDRACWYLRIFQLLDAAGARFRRSSRRRLAARPPSIKVLAVKPGPVAQFVPASSCWARASSRRLRFTTLIVAERGRAGRRNLREDARFVRRWPKRGVASPASVRRLHSAEAGVLDGRRATHPLQRTRHFVRGLSEDKTGAGPHSSSATATSGVRRDQRGSIWRWRWRRKTMATDPRMQAAAQLRALPPPQRAASRNFSRCWN